MAEFWSLTPRELTAVFRAQAWRWKQEQRQLMYAVWHVAALQRAKKMPSLRKVLGDDKAKPLTAQQRLRVEVVGLSAEGEMRKREFEELKERMHGQ